MARPHGTQQKLATPKAATHAVYNFALLLILFVALLTG